MPTDTPALPARLQLLEQFDRVRALANAGEPDPHALLGRAMAPHLDLVRTLLSMGAPGEPMAFQAQASPGTAVRYAMELAELKADAWRLDWTASMTGEANHEFQARTIDALVSAEALANAEPPMLATLTPLYFDRAGAPVAALLEAACEVSGLIEPRDGSAGAARERLHAAAAALLPCFPTLERR